MITDVSRMFSLVMSQAWYMGMLREWAAHVTSVAHDPVDILEVGCGPGLLAIELKSATNRVWGIDKSPRMIARARKLAARRDVQVEFVRADLTTTSLPGLAADMVLGASIINVVKDRPAFAHALTRLVKPRGVLSLAAPTPRLNEASAAAYAKRAGLGSLSTAILLTWAGSARKMRPSEIVSVLPLAEFARSAGTFHLDGLVASVTFTRRSGGNP